MGRRLSALLVSSPGQLERSGILGRTFSFRSKGNPATLRRLEGLGIACFDTQDESACLRSLPDTSALLGCGVGVMFLRTRPAQPLLDSLNLSAAL